MKKLLTAVSFFILASINFKANAQCDLTVTINPSGNFHCYGNTVTDTAVATDNYAIASYSWSTGGTNDTIVVVNPPPGINSYTVTVTDVSSCVASYVLTDTIDFPVYGYPQNITICEGSTGTLTANITGGTPSYTYNWSTGATTSSIDVSPAFMTVYTLSVADSMSCGLGFFMYDTVFVKGTPYTFITDPSPTCYLSETLLTTTVTDTSNSTFTYNWSNGSTHDTADVSPPINTVYTLIVTDGNGCKDTAFTLAQVWPLPTVRFDSIFGHRNDTLCVGSPAKTLTGGYPPGGTYSGPMVAGGMFTPSSPGSFWILYSYTDAHTCTDTASHLINVQVCLDVQNIASSGFFDLYPNPANNTVFVKFSSQAMGSSANIIITDVTGRIIDNSINAVGSNLILPFDITTYPAGMYFVKITTGNSTQVSKFVKE